MSRPLILDAHGNALVVEPTELEAYRELVFGAFALLARLPRAAAFGPLPDADQWLNMVVERLAPDLMERFPGLEFRRVAQEPPAVRVPAGRCELPKEATP